MGLELDFRVQILLCDSWLCDPGRSSLMSLVSAPLLFNRQEGGISLLCGTRSSGGPALISDLRWTCCVGGRRAHNEPQREAWSPCLLLQAAVCSQPPGTAAASSCPPTMVDTTSLLCSDTCSHSLPSTCAAPQPGWAHTGLVFGLRNWFLPPCAAA